MNEQTRPSDTFDLLTSWLAVIGALTMYWSPIERQIDQSVHLLYAQSSSKNNKPTRLSAKLDFIKNNIPGKIIKPEELDSLIKSTKTTVQIRDVFVHGVLISYNNQQIEVGKVDGRKKEHVIEKFTIDRDRLNRSANALDSLCKQWDSIVSALLLHGGNA